MLRGDFVSAQFGLAMALQFRGRQEALPTTRIRHRMIQSAVVRRRCCHSQLLPHDGVAELLGHSEPGLDAGYSRAGQLWMAGQWQWWQWRQWRKRCSLLLKCRAVLRTAAAWE